MSPQFVLHDQEALLTRLLLNHQEGKRTVFLVGSPLTAPWEDGGPGVPGVAAMVERARRMLEKVGKPVKSEDYQTVFQALQGSHGLGRINALVREAVLDACVLDGDLRKRALDGDQDACAELERKHDAWALSPGVEALGRLIASAPEIFGGELLTSNFDPLLSVSIRKAGGRAWETRLHGDGHLDASQAEGCRVIQVHGAWYGTDTLHHPAQLQAERPALQDFLRRRFEHATLVVVAYGGWKDVFTRTLFELVKAGGAFPEILWTFYSRDREEIRSTHAELFDGLRPGIDRGRVDCFGGIDCNLFLPALVEQVASMPSVRGPAPDPISAAKMPPLAIAESPFIAGPPIERDEDFFGRWQERKAIREAARHVQPVQILGERRMGKTSLLRWVRRHVFEWPGIKDWALACITAQGSGGQSPASFVQAIGWSLGEGEKVARQLVEGGSPEAVIRTMLPLVLLVDEADELTASGRGFEDGFLETLRGLGQDRQLFWISTSLRDLHRTFQAKGRTSAFLNDSVLVTVGRLDHQAVVALTARGGWENTVTEKLFEESGGFAYAHQTLARSLFHGIPIQLADDELVQVMEPVFDGWWRHRTKAEQELLRRALTGMAVEDLERRERQTARALVRLGLLAEVEESFRLPGAAWRRYVAEQ